MVISLLSCGSLTYRLVMFPSAVPLPVPLLDTETTCTHSRACLAHGLQLGRSLSHCAQKIMVREQAYLAVWLFKEHRVFLVSESDGRDSPLFSAGGRSDKQVTVGAPSQMG